MRPYRCNAAPRVRVGWRGYERYTRSCTVDSRAHGTYLSRPASLPADRCVLEHPVLRTGLMKGMDSSVQRRPCPSCGSESVGRSFTACTPQEVEKIVPEYSRMVGGGRGDTSRSCSLSAKCTACQAPSGDCFVFPRRIPSISATASLYDCIHVSTLLRYIS